MELSEIIEKFLGKRVVVIGDIILDKYIYGDVSRISPEAPVQVVKTEKEAYSLGGASNVASNISSLGGKAVLFGFVGKDNEGEKIKELLKEKGIEYYFGDNSRTTLKVRVVARNQQAIRIDYEDVGEKIFDSEIKEVLKKEVEKADIVLISDYAKGAVTEDLMDLLKKQEKKIIVDPKPKNIKLYKGVFLLTPNESESLEMSNAENFLSAGKFLRDEFNSNILITRGKEGMTLFSDKTLEIPTYAQEVYDVTGAGDGVLACLALAISSNATLEQAAILANHAAGIVVGKAGTYQVKLNELKTKIFGEESKIKTLKELNEIIDDLRKKRKVMVWTNGCFDLIHEGHIRYLKKAKEQGDCLIIGLNSDESVREVKGLGRPVRPEKARAEIISCFGFVDYVTIFDEEDTTKHLSLLKPEIYVKGGDYTLATINQDERKIIESYKGKIVIIPLEEHISTSKIIDRIKNSGDEKGG